jgi:hypothetical protein
VLTFFDHYRGKAHQPDFPIHLHIVEFTRFRNLSFMPRINTTSHSFGWTSSVSCIAKNALLLMQFWPASDGNRSGATEGSLNRNCCLEMPKWEKN